ncbi:TlpA family protein disulfide reductase [Peptostreptococcaceae bacterium OttesenSCG-928-C18]|nr:TlpA family protein disulfide reductase [Peptostreptococcaceae bacterium OttesenSCG-928-C18]
MKKTIISILLILTLFTLSSCKKENNKDTENSTTNTEITSAESTEITETTEVINEEGFEVGDIAPDFNVKLLSGETVKLTDFRGKPVLLNFWATWCPPCQYEMPDFQKLYNEYGDNLIILAVNLGEAENEVNTYIEENKYTYRIGLDEMAEIKYPVLALPTTLLIDKEGKIKAFEEGIPAEDVYGFYKEQIDLLLQ